MLILQTLNKSMVTCVQTSVNSREKTWCVLLVAVFFEGNVTPKLINTLLQF